MGHDNLVFVEGALLPALELTIRRRGVIVGLEPYVDPPATMKARVAREGLASIERSLVADTDPSSGKARLFWQPGDLQANGDEWATYELEVHLTNSLGEPEISPDPLRFRVRPALTPP